MLPEGKNFQGAPSLAELPGVKNYVETILFVHSAAQNRRRSEERTSVGLILSRSDYSYY